MVADYRVCYYNPLLLNKPNKLSKYANNSFINSLKCVSNLILAVLLQKLILFIKILLSTLCTMCVLCAGCNSSQKGMQNFSNYLFYSFLIELVCSQMYAFLIYALYFTIWCVYVAAYRVYLLRMSIIRCCYFPVIFKTSYCWTVNSFSWDFSNP